MKDMFKSSPAGRLFLAILLAVAFALAAPTISLADGIVTFQAESGALGSNFTNGTDGAVQFISISTDTVNTDSPGNANRVATYSVTFPAAGTYKLYGRVRVGPLSANDDSFFYANGFGTKSATTGGDWITVNNVDVNSGFVISTDVVSGSGSAGINVWKWLSLSDYTGTSGETPISFTVTAGNLTQTFQVGARENGFDMDKFVFGTTGTAFTVSNLDTGTLPAPPPAQTNAFAGPDGVAFHRFGPLNSGSNSDGANPSTGLALAGDVLVGTTLNGGSQGVGTAFAMSPDGTNFNAFRTFSATDAANPQGGLAFSGSTFYGSSLGGGTSGVGTVFTGQTNGSLAVLRSFAVVNADYATNAGGASPGAALALSGTTLYGTTTAGGAAANGTVFSLSTSGATFSLLHNFSLLDSQAGTNTDGALPWGGLIVSGSTLYGTTSAGGVGGVGTVFSISTSGANFTTLYSFPPMDTLTATNPDGAMPFGGLVLSNGTLYGTTFAGGSGGRGTIFSLQTDGSGFTVLHHFTATDPVTGTNTDGASPGAGLCLSDNVLYGTASAGGTGAAGSVFALNLSISQFATIHSFSARANNGTNADGAFPVAPVLRLGNSLYGTAFSGGPGAAGTVFGVSIPAPPAIITNIIRNLDGSVTLHCLGAPNSTNIIQATASLTPPVLWQNVSTNVADAGGAWQYTDSNNSTTTRIYRSYAP